MNDTRQTPSAQTPSEPQGMKLHMGIAEQGKLYALKGDHRRALLYYREAMHMTVQARDPEIFFRHYLECVIESLEQTESYGEVLEYCDKVLAYYIEHPPPNPVAIMDLAHTYQRKAVVLLKMDEREPAKECFRHALSIAAEVGKVTAQTLPLSQTVLQWLESGWHIDKARLLGEQQRTGYFSVRRDKVDARRAVKLPHENVLLARR